MKVKWWFALLLLEWCCFLLSAFFAVLVWVVLLSAAFSPCVVQIYPPSFLVLPADPSLQWVVLVSPPPSVRWLLLSRLFLSRGSALGGAAFSSWVLSSSPSSGWCCALLLSCGWCCRSLLLKFKWNFFFFFKKVFVRCGCCLLHPLPREWCCFLLVCSATFSSLLEVVLPLSLSHTVS